MRISFVFLPVIRWSFRPLRAGGGAVAKRQDVHAFRPLDRIEAHDGGLAAEFDCRNDRIQFGGVEIALELLAGLPILDEQQGPAAVEIRIQAGIQTPPRDPPRSKHRVVRTPRAPSSTRTRRLHWPACGRMGSSSAPPGEAAFAFTAPVHNAELGRLPAARVTRERICQRPTAAPGSRTA